MALGHFTESSFAQLEADADCANDPCKQAMRSRISTSSEGLIDTAGRPSGHAKRDSFIPTCMLWML